MTPVPIRVDHYRVQPLENPELRQHLGLPIRPLDGEDGGVLISKLGPDAVCEGVLREGDVLLAVDGHPIGPDGTVPLPEAPSVRVGMRHCVQRVPLGTTIEYVVLRDDERLQLHVQSSTRKPRLLPPRLPVPRPEWLVLGGLVFTPLLPDYEGLVPKSKLQDVYGPPTVGCEQVSARRRGAFRLVSPPVQVVSIVSPLAATPGHARQLM